MRHSLEVSFLFPLGLFGLGEHHQRTLGIQSADFFQHPHALHARNFKFEDADLGQAMSEERFCFFEGGAMNDPKVCRVQTGAESFRERSV